MNATAPTVVILCIGDGAVGFVVRDTGGKALASSAPFATICRLESALSTLISASMHEWAVTTHDMGSVVSVGRRRVPLREPRSRAEIAAAIAAAACARIVDQRPANRRRYDLTGMRCDMSH